MATNTEDVEEQNREANIERGNAFKFRGGV